MKHAISNICILLAMILLASCTREVLTITPPANEYVPLEKFELGWRVDDAEIYTKAEQTIYNENRVRNLYVMLFNEKGTLIHKKRYLVTTSSYNDLNDDIKDRYDDVINSFYNRNEGVNPSSGIIPGFFNGANITSIDVLSGSLTFYAIANYTPSTEGAKLDQVDSEEKLKNIEVNIDIGSVGRNSFLMTATQDVQLNPTLENGQVKVERIGTNLELKRLDSKITFNIGLDITDAKAGTVLFGSPTFAVHKIPNITYLIGRDRSASSSNWDAANEESEFSCMTGENFNVDATGQFTFYLRENRPVPDQEHRITKEAFNTENSSGKAYPNLYSMREAWAYDGIDNNPGAPVCGRKFTYAPENSTFVEISGYLSYTRTNSDGSEDEIAGNVTYIIHLGETGLSDKWDDESSVNNYDVRRNVHYIYNMKITGISSFEVEVKEDGTERRPGAEGDLTISDNKQYNMDAHYGRILFELDRESILGLKDADGNWTGAGWNVDTHFGKTGFDPETGLINSPYDYKWVLFAINAEFNTPSDQMVKFPGVQAYDGGVKFFDNGRERVTFEPDKLKEDIANDTGNKLARNLTFKDYLETDYANYYHSQFGSEIDDDACLRDINQLLKHLYNEAISDPGDNLFVNGKVAITAFCDEYTYIYDPTRDDYLHPGHSLDNENDGEQSRRLGLWKEYVNANERVMNITPMQATDISDDGNTSITHSFVSISQLSIKTIYDKDNDKVMTAWGLETTNETGMLEPGDYTNGLKVGSRNNTHADGRTNFINFWINDNNSGEYKWKEVMTVDQSIDNAEGLHEKFRDAFHACITRNRDLDGNNVIDKDEIFWYLAARDQLTGLWIGQTALNESAWMYKGSGGARHFITSSERTWSEGGNYWILWSEEGSSLGGLRISGDDEPTYDYRCVRNLGIDINDEEAPQHYATIKNNSNYYTIDVSYINPAALRREADNGTNLPFGNEKSQSNRPFREFDVRYNNENRQINWSNIEGYIENNQDYMLCPYGWRVPNQREFSIMMGLIDSFLSGNGHVLIATSFSFNGEQGYDSENGNKYNFTGRPGFYYTKYDASANLALISGDASGYIRCVRDTPSAY